MMSDSQRDSIVDPEFSPVLALLVKKGQTALDHFRAGTHCADIAPELLSHIRTLNQEARRCVDRLLVGKRDLEAQEKRVAAELNEQRAIVLGEMERESADARARMKALKEQQASAAASGGTLGGSPPTSPGTSPTFGNSSTPLVGGKRLGRYLTGTALSKESGSSAMPGDVDYWRAQAQDLALVVEGRREALKSVTARIRSIAHLDEHQARAHGVVGLLRQAEAAERQKAAGYLRRAHALKERAGLTGSGGGGKDMKNASSVSSNSQTGGDGGGGEEETCMSAVIEAEWQGLQAIVNVLEPRVEVAKEAARLYLARTEQLKERLDQVDGRRRGLSNMSGNLQAVLKYIADVKQECQDKQASIAPPNTTIVQILRKQHSEALHRISRGADSLMALRLEVADLETQLRECRVNAIRFMHGTSEGTRQRLAQLRALKGAEVVESQILAIEMECSQLKAALAASMPSSASSGSSSTSPSTMPGRK